MNEGTVKVRALPHAMVPDVKATDERLRRYIGWKWNPESKSLEIAGPVEIKLCKEYRRAIAAGDLELFI